MNYLDILNNFNNKNIKKEEVEKKEQNKVPEKPKQSPKKEVKKEPIKSRVQELKNKPKPAPKKEVKKEPIKSRVQELKNRPKPTPKKEEPKVSKPTVISAKTVTKPKKPSIQQALDQKPKQVDRKPISNPKISIVMQSYLGDYPGSRSNPVFKIKRLIASFLKQTYSNCELIVISDGCKITHDLWFEEIKGIPRIKYAYVDKEEGDNMYVEGSSGKKYRGVPRSVGVTLATGDIITYADSDDFLMSYFCEMIAVQHKSNPNSDWMFNTSWFDHKNTIEINKNSTVLKSFEGARVIKMPNLNDEIFIETSVNDGMVVNTPWLLAHMAHCDVKWIDSSGAVSEDTLFGRTLRAKYPTGHTYSSPTYIRCHFPCAWDV